MRSPASLPMFFRETLSEVNDQRKLALSRFENPANAGLLKRLMRQANLVHKAFVAGDSPEQIVQELVQVAAIASRLAIESDPAYPEYRWPYS